jgi:hypothetical protein
MNYCFSILAALVLLLFSGCKKEKNQTTQETEQLSLTPLSFQNNWSRVISSNLDDRNRGGTSTIDGGYVSIGYASANDGDISGLAGKSDVLVVKFDAVGNKIWQRLIGGLAADEGKFITELPDGSFVGVGHTESKDGPFHTNQGYVDALVFKLNKNGDVMWVKTLGANHNEYAQSVFVAQDGSMVVAGNQVLRLGIAVSNAMVVKLDPNGNLVWFKTFGGSEQDMALSVQPSGDGGYVLGGHSNSSDGDVGGIARWWLAYWLFKVDNDGKLLWSKTYGGSHNDILFTHISTSDGYLLTGYTGSKNGDVTELKGLFDAWVVKVDKNGNLLWQKTYGGTDYDDAAAITPTKDGGFLLGVNSRSNDGDFPSNVSGQDVWIVKIDALGNKIGQQSLGAPLSHQIHSLAAGADGSYALFGSVISKDGIRDPVTNLITNDAWIMKFRDR